MRKESKHTAPQMPMQGEHKNKQWSALALRQTKPRQQATVRSEEQINYKSTLSERLSKPVSRLGFILTWGGRGAVPCVVKIANRRRCFIVGELAPPQPPSSSFVHFNQNVG